MDIVPLSAPALSGRLRALRVAFALAAAVAAAAFFAAPSARADFGISAFTSTATNRDGSLDFEPGSHPYEYTIGLTMKLDASSEPEGTLGALRLDLPAGLLGNPLAVPRCLRQDFEGLNPRCPGDSQIGVVELLTPGFGSTRSPIYNLVPLPGTIASFGFGVSGFSGFEQASIRAGGDYGLTETIDPVPSIQLQAISETLWGVPAEPTHDAERVCVGAAGAPVEGCASDAPPAPLLTLPTSCAAALETNVVVEEPQPFGAVAGKSAFSLDAGGTPASLIGCQSLPFRPAMTLGFESFASDSPTGVSVGLHLPQREAGHLSAAAALRDAVVELPDGIALNPPVAAGLGACSPAQIGLKSVPGDAPGEFSPAPAACPDAARIGSVEVDAPLVDHALTGGIYLATPYENPFGSLLAVYFVVDDEQSGIVLKLPVQLGADPGTGRLALRLDDAPQLPFEDLKLSFRGGPRAVLRTPPVCGTTRITARLTPWSAPEGRDAVLVNSLRTSPPAGGAGRCPATEAQAPNKPGFTAGTLVPAAGAYSPFLLRLSRADGSQRLGRIEATLPSGLTGNLAGIPYCPEASVATARCPAASEVGSVDIAAGAGPSPLHLGGHVYLAGPYEGAPLSLEVLTPAVAGPFDLGTVAVRIALHVDPRSARIRAVSDPLPTILRGIPLDIRSLGLDLDRPSFALNPTSCEAQRIEASSSSSLGQTVRLAGRFQVGNCASLGFDPKVAVRLLGAAHRGAHPRLRAVVTGHPGDANVRNVAVTLPATGLLDNRHIRAVCSRERLAAGSCPQSSIVGQVKVWTPLLSRPLEGPVYLRSSKRRLPDLAASLDGQVQIDLSASVRSVDGRLRVAFGALPDAPVSKFVLTMAGGRRGLLVNTGGVCARRPRVAVSLRAQSGKGLDLGPLLRTDCAKAGKKK